MQTKGATLSVTLRVAVNGHPPGTRVALDCRRSGIGSDMAIATCTLLFGRTSDGKPIILIVEELE